MEGMPKPEVVEPRCERCGGEDFDVLCDVGVALRYPLTWHAGERSWWLDSSAGEARREVLVEREVVCRGCSKDFVMEERRVDPYDGKKRFFPLDDRSEIEDLAVELAVRAERAFEAPGGGEEGESWVAVTPAPPPSTLDRGHSHTCAACGRLFTGARADTRYCSNACRQRAYRQRGGAQ
jgi:hypothetical protein